MLEPVLLRSKTKPRHFRLETWVETTAQRSELMTFNGITADAIAKRAIRYGNSLILDFRLGNLGLWLWVLLLLGMQSILDSGN
jgi:hypothetical protein